MSPQQTAETPIDGAKALALIAKLERDLARFTAGGLLNAHMICDQRDKAVADLARERARWEWLSRFVEWTDTFITHDRHAGVMLYKAGKPLGTGPTLSAATTDAMDKEAK